MVLGNYNYYICWNLACSVFTKGLRQIKALTTFIYPTHEEKYSKIKKMNNNKENERSFVLISSFKVISPKIEDREIFHL